MPRVELTLQTNGEWEAQIGEKHFTGHDPLDLLNSIGTVDWRNLQMTVDWIGSCQKCNGHGHNIHTLPDGVNSPFLVQCDVCMGMGTKVP